MSSETMHQHCWDLARELLQSLEGRDLALIERTLTPLRQTLAIHRCLSDGQIAEDHLLWLERLDLLEGITESLSASVEGIRSSTQTHLSRMQTAKSLLRHLVDERAFQCVLPVC